MQDFALTRQPRKSYLKERYQAPRRAACLETEVIMQRSPSPLRIVSALILAAFCIFMIKQRVNNEMQQMELQDQYRQEQREASQVRLQQETGAILQELKQEQAKQVEDFCRSYRSLSPKEQKEARKTGEEMLSLIVDTESRRKLEECLKLPKPRATDQP
jgi:hypothetical protein